MITEYILFTHLTVTLNIKFKKWNRALIIHGKCIHARANECNMIKQTRLSGAREII